MAPSNISSGVFARPKFEFIFVHVNPILKCPLGVSSGCGRRRGGFTPPPGMVRGRLVGRPDELNALGLLDGGVDAFLIVQGDGWLAFVEDAVRQWPPLVEQGHGAIEGLADSDLGAPQAIALALSRELILPVLVLEGEILREFAVGEQAEDQVQFLWIVQYRSVCIGGILRGYGEALVVVAQEAWEKSIGRIDV